MLNSPILKQLLTTTERERERGEWRIIMLSAFYEQSAVFLQTSRNGGGGGGEWGILRVEIHKS